MLKRRNLLTYGLLLVILLVGAYLRLWRISEYLTFLGDEGRDVLIVKRMIVDHKFTLLGPTASVGGFFMGPIYYYFMLPFLWLWQLDPTGPAVMVALFGVLTIYVVYKTGRDFFDPWVGLVAASLYALSPFVVAYSRSSWNPNVVPFFSIVLIWLLWKMATSYRPRYLFAVGLVLGIGLQLHYLFLFLFFLVAFWLVLFRQVIRQAFHMLWLLAGFIIGDFLFLAFEVRHGFPNAVSIMRFLATGKDTGLAPSNFLGNITDVVYRLFGRLVLRLPDQGMFEQLTDGHQLIWRLGVWLFVLLCVGTPLMILLQRRKKTGNHALWVAETLLLVWLFVPLALFGIYKKDIYDYYFGIFYPLPFLLTGYAFWKLWRTPVSKIILSIIFCWLIIFEWQGRPFVYPANNQMGQVKRIAREALDKTDNKPFNFALITTGNSDHAYRYFFEIWGRVPVTIEYEGVDPQRKSVTDQLIVICEAYECQPLGHSLWEIAGFGRAEVAGVWDVPFVKIYKLVHFREKDGI